MASSPIPRPQRDVVAAGGGPPRDASLGACPLARPPAPTGLDRPTRSGRERSRANRARVPNATDSVFVPIELCVSIDDGSTAIDEPVASPGDVFVAPRLRPSRAFVARVRARGPRRSRAARADFARSRALRIEHADTAVCVHPTANHEPRVDRFRAGSGVIDKSHAGHLGWLGSAPSGRSGCVRAFAVPRTLVKESS